MDKPYFKSKSQLIVVLVFTILAILTFIGAFYHIQHAINCGLCLYMVWGTYKYW